jgi:multidrug efflux system membrane fusion protein
MMSLATTNEPATPSKPPRRGQRGRRWVWTLLIVLGGVGGFWIFSRGAQGAKEPRPAAPGAAAQSAARGVPVVAARARMGDMNVYLTGLGAIVPLNTVLVHSRVDGEIDKVAFVEGQIVQKGDLLAEIDPRPFEVQLTQAEGQAAKDEATLKNAKLDLKRDRTLVEQGLIPKQQSDTQLALVNQYEGALKSDQGQIDSATLNLVYSRITSPLTGRVGLRLVDPGNVVHASDSNGIVIITQLDPITVVFTLPEDVLPQIQEQTRGGRKLEIDAYDRELKRKLGTGTLMTLDNQIDQTTGTIKLKALFPNKDDSLFPNQFVNARLLVSKVKGTVIVPSAAVQRSPQSMFVYVILPNNTVEPHDVEVRMTEGEDTAVASGVTPGQLVVTDGVDKLQKGTAISARIVGGPGAQKATK